MAGNSFGSMFKFTTFGESHGEALGVIIDGLPAGLNYSMDDLKAELKRRAPGHHQVHTGRKEDDLPEILSGVFEGKTLGTPLTVIVRNTAQRSQDYDALKAEYRPGHADKTTMQKYGFRDHRGGGRASGRETVARVIAGYFAGLILPQVSFYAYIAQLAHFKLEELPADHLVDRGEINVPDKNMTKEVISFLTKCKTDGESAGGIVNLSIKGSPAGLGEPVFDKLKAELAKAMLSIPACVGMSLGAGFDLALRPGSETSKDRTNFGGIEGGITNGEEIFLKVAFKAPSTVGKKAQEGRHDPCILPRVIPVVEAMAKVVMADHYLRQAAYLAFVSSDKDQ
ncbi:MAG TPA: chorismate synthase [Bacteriovoracaceae bacterium]|nr:chorismate synthase [Bacteriovoracaceae bacterium]